MEKSPTALVKYESSPESLRTALELSSGLDGVKGSDRVLIKPNLVALDDSFPMPRYGVLTTTRLVQDMVIVLKELGVDRITIAEGSSYGRNYGVPTEGIFEALGYRALKDRYGVELTDLHKDPFTKTAFGDEILEVSERVLSTDFLINMPVMKTHLQAVVSLGLKNLKGCISMESRKKCHASSESLDRYIAGYVEKLPPALTVIDGVYGLEKGPFYYGKAVRMDVLVASRDALSADVAGAAVMGYLPEDIPHIRMCAETRGRGADPAELNLVGERIQDVRRPLRWDNPWRTDNTGPMAWDRIGIRGVSLPKYDKTLCTGCSALYNPILLLIMAGFRGEPFNEVEILTGKEMRPSGSAEKTLLVGNCMIKENRSSPGIREKVLLSGCPPSMEDLMDTMKVCGFHGGEEAISEFKNALVQRYKGKPEFDESFFSAS